MAAAVLNDPFRGHGERFPQWTLARRLSRQPLMPPPPAFSCARATVSALWPPAAT
jgi:hypothetical protein